MTTPADIRAVLDGTLPVRECLDRRLVEAINAVLAAEDAEIEREILEGYVP